MALKMPQDLKKRLKECIIEGIMKKNAFTLVELLVVIMIVGILVAVSIPIITSVAEKAKWTEAIQTLGMIKRALRPYYVEFGEYPSGFYLLNTPDKNCPARLDMGIPDPDAEGRYVYFLLPKAIHPLCAIALHDKDNNHSVGVEPFIVILLDGGFVSYNEAPEF